MNADDDDDLRPDIAAAKARMRLTDGGGREIRRLEWVLHDDEPVERMATGLYGSGVGLLALTDRRLLFFHRGWLSQTLEDFPLDRITSVLWHVGMVGGTVTIHASGKRAEITKVQKDDGRELTDRLRERLAMPAPVPSAADGIIEQIRRLGELRDAGILTDEEFETKKAELLRRL